jgi:hypothetical protein
LTTWSVWRSKYLIFSFSLIFLSDRTIFGSFGKPRHHCSDSSRWALRDHNLSGIRLSFGWSFICCLRPCWWLHQGG